MKKQFTKEEIKKMRERPGVRRDRFDVDQFGKGMNLKVGMGILILILISFAGAQHISSGTITTIVEEFDSGFIVDEIQKIYEISDSSLEEGYSVALNEKDAFRIKIRERDYYIVVWNIADEVSVIFPGERQLVFGVDEIILVDVNWDGKLDIQLELKAIENYDDAERQEAKRANIFIKEIVEKELIPSGDYFELFDVTVRLIEEEIYTARELGAFITFENFGEGNSKIDIVYSIIDEDGLEVYRGVDSKIVQTEDRVVKYFDFLELPFGKYILRTEIFYGQNQTGESEQDFEIVEMSFLSRLLKPLIFIFIVIILFFIVKYTGKDYRNKEIKEEDK